MGINERLFEFIEKSPTPFHAVANARAKLEEKPGQNEEEDL